MFDLDGTLLDTAQDMMDALNRLRAEEQLAPLPYETVRCQVSHGANALVRLSFGELPAAEHEAMRTRLLDIYRKQLAKHTCLFEGGDEMLAALESRGLHWGIVTNKPGWLTDPLLVEVGLHTRARAVVSGDTLPNASRIPCRCCTPRRRWAFRPPNACTWATPNATCRRRRPPACTRWSPVTAISATTIAPRAGSRMAGWTRRSN